MRGKVWVTIELYIVSFSALHFARKIAERLNLAILQIISCCLGLDILDLRKSQKLKISQSISEEVSMLHHYDVCCTCDGATLIGTSVRV